MALAIPTLPSAAVLVGGWRGGLVLGLPGPGMGGGRGVWVISSGVGPWLT